jgi:hypothetical protein
VIPAVCTESVNHSKIKCEDGKRYIVFLNPSHETFLKVRVDGCVVSDGRRADWVLEQGRVAIIIELKGRDVEHGADQVYSTTHLWLRAEQRCEKVAGIIVARQYPKASTSIQRKQQAYARAFKAPLHVVNHNPEVNFAKVLLFSGPFKLA